MDRAPMYYAIKIKYLNIDRENNIVLQNTLFVYLFGSMNPEIYNHNAEIEHFHK